MSDFVPSDRHLRQVLLFLFLSKKTAAEAHRELRQVYGEAALSDTTCHEWFLRFHSNHFNIDEAETDAVHDMKHIKSENTIVRQSGRLRPTTKSARRLMAQQRLQKLGVTEAQMKEANKRQYQLAKLRRASETPEQKQDRLDRYRYRLEMTSIRRRQKTKQKEKIEREKRQQEKEAKKTIPRKQKKQELYEEFDPMQTEVKIEDLFEASEVKVEVDADPQDIQMQFESVQVKIEYDPD